MTSVTIPYRVSAAGAVLLGSVLVAIALGLAADRQHCAHAQRVASAASADLVSTRLPSFDRDVSSGIPSFIDAEHASMPRPTCGPEGPVGIPGSASVRPVRLADRNDRGPQRTEAMSVVGARGSGLHRSERERGLPDTSPLLTRASGTLETVRSVVLRL
jgi:hypothetical protein